MNKPKACQDCEWVAKFWWGIRCSVFLPPWVEKTECGPNEIDSHPEMAGICPCFKRAEAEQEVDCRHGWLPFWGEGERAGLKEMGSLQDLSMSDFAIGVRTAIQAYVHAARKAKEGR